MSAKRSSGNARFGARGNVRTWVEIDSRAAKKNVLTFRKLIGKGLAGKNPALWAVVKSNAYGHGLFAFSEVMDQAGVDGFCVDSAVEGLALRKSGIKKPILVLGQTLSTRMGEAAKNDITISIANVEALQALMALTRGSGKNIPRFHIKIDSGMHRQGFYPEELPRVIRLLHASTPAIKSGLKGIFTHFASAKDINYPAYTDMQFEVFQRAATLFEKAGFNHLMKHAAATGGTLIAPKYHLDAVRVGIGLYGLWPSRELEMQKGQEIVLHPVLSWRTAVSEVKSLKKGDYVGYDLTERVVKDMKMAVLPIGYWHGFPRALSSTGDVIIRGERARVLGRISMDMAAVGLPKGTKVKHGDVVTLIGRDGKEEIPAAELSEKSGTSHYEFLTRLNPLMERVVV